MNKRTLTKRMMYVQFTNPAAYPPLEHSSRMAAEAGWQVLFLGTGAIGANSLRFPPHPRIRERRLPPLPAAGRSWLRYLYFVAWVAWWGVVWRPSLVYASDFLTSPIALLLSFVGLTVIYHEHDSPTSAAGDPARRICLAARRHLARRAARCVLPNATRAERFAREMGTADNTVCVWNCPSREEVGPPRPPIDQAEALWAVYHGSIVPSRLPPSVVAALARAPRAVKLRVIGYETVGHPGYVDQLRSMARQLGVDQRIDFVGAVPTRAELLEWTRRSDVGIAFMPKVAQASDDHEMVGASNKPFDYLANGVPLLVADLPDWRSLYVEPGYGLACDPDDPASIAAALAWFLTHPAERRAMGERGRQRIADEWNYEAQFAPVYRQVVCHA